MSTQRSRLDRPLGIRTILGTCIGGFILASMVADNLPRIARAMENKPVYYAGCNDARAAGVTPIYRWEPGYRPEMDGDDDGIACEPHH